MGNLYILNESLFCMHYGQKAFLIYISLKMLDGSGLYYRDMLTVFVAILMDADLDGIWFQQETRFSNKTINLLTQTAVVVLIPVKLLSI